MGPLVVAGVASAEGEPFSDLGLRDSKQLSPRAREKLESVIRERADRVEVNSASAIELDMWRTTMSLNEIEVRMFGVVARALRCDAYIVDAADVDAKRFGVQVSAALRHDAKVFAAHRADENEPIVSAASIIAKVVRDREMEKISRRMEQKYGLPCGSGYPSDPVTRNFLDTVVREHGRLPEDCRKGWKTATDCLERNGVRPEAKLTLFDGKPQPV